MNIQLLLNGYARAAKIRLVYMEHYKSTPAIIQEIRALPYVEQWLKCKTNGWFHVYLPDHSFFTFSEGDKASYSFIDSPIDALDITDFLKKEGVEPTQRTISQHQEEYDLYVSTAKKKKHVTPIRYDRDFSSYRSGIHPAAHIHIGAENNIRIAVRKELNALSFFLFVLRQKYPIHWEFLLESTHRKKLSKVIRDSLIDIDKEFINENDHCEHYLA